MNDESSGGGTSLSCRTHCAKYDGYHGHFEVGFGCEDDGVVATQFEDGFAQSLSNHFRHSFSHSCAACGADEGNSGVVAHGFTDFAIALYQTKYAFGKVVIFENRLDDVLHCCCAGWCFF